jgi:pyrophosphate--fructose-6-phosphate 1-phosphotransferase
MCNGGWDMFLCNGSGGHNVICGLYDYLQRLNPKNSLFGFIDGPDGILKSKFISITQDLCAAFINQGT